MEFAVIIPFSIVVPFPSSILIIPFNDRELLASLDTDNILLTLWLHIKILLIIQNVRS